MRAVVTAGGTREPIDDVRYVTNFSSGRFGTALARALVERGLSVTLLASRQVDTSGLPEAVQVVPFGSAADLKAALDEATDPPPDLLFMAAAVADYSPVPEAGKIRSTDDELVIRMRRNPKILGTLRERCGPGTFLVGFKLLSGSHMDALLDIARHQNRRDRLNLTLANDLSELGGNRHPGWLVTPEGGALRVDGTKQDVARQLVDFCLKRRAVRWHRSERQSSPPPRGPGFDRAGVLLRTAIDGDLLPGLDGNVTARAEGGLWATPRQVRKAALTADDLVYASVSEGVVRYHGEKKASIDTAVHARLYEALPEIEGLLHFHGAVVLPDARTTFPWPCGTLEEADEILDALARSALAGRWTGGPFAVELVDHGSLVGVTDVLGLLAEWAAVREGWFAHLRDIEAPWQDKARAQPIFRSGRIVGVRGRFEGVDGVTIWLDPSHRGGLGDAVAEAIGASTVLVHERCDVLDWWTERGWQVADRDPGVLRLTPPHARADLREAASVCLLDPVHRKVLIGRRKVPPWEGWWAFPGGSVDPGESLRDAAVRELHEETGLRASGTPLRTTVVYVGGSDRVYRVTNFVLPVFTPEPPAETGELAARWVDLDEARALRPMAAGTRRVIRKLTD